MIDISFSSISDAVLSPAKLFESDSDEYVRKSKDSSAQHTTASFSSRIKHTNPLKEIPSEEDSTTGTSITCSSTVSELSNLEQKRLSLRHQRFSLERRLYEFGCKHAEGGKASFSTKPTKHVMEMNWKDKHTGIKVLYSGPINEVEEPHGTGGVMKFSDGQVYRGNLYCGSRCGVGSNTWPDGQNYSGEWKDNHRNGKGRHAWPDGRTVSGEWKDGHLDGRVTFAWPNGSTYEGRCFMGKKHGRGVHTWADGRIFSGHYVRGKENGIGTLTLTNGVKYRGEFKNGMKEGYGVMLWKTRTYDGEWAQDMPHGQGRVVWHNGATYTGELSEGKYNGMGVYVWPSGKRFVGRWENGIKEGKGLYVWPDGKQYDGDYQNGMKHGYGELTMPDGSCYCGEWKENLRHGKGLLVEAGGQVVYHGLWQNDKRVDAVANGDIDSGNASVQSEKENSPDKVKSSKSEPPEAGALSNAPLPKTSKHDPSQVVTPSPAKVFTFNARHR